jgi:hypothetical protein
VDPPAGSFHRWTVLGSIVISDAPTRKQLNAALKFGTEKGRVFPAGCFNPRHGIRASLGGKTFDLVICFECSGIMIFDGDQSIGSFLVSPLAQPEFDRILRAKEIPLPKKAE